MTAVEWFFRWVNDNPEATHKEYAEAFKQAKEMEKNSYICSKCKSQINGNEVMQQMQGSEKSD